ncbi:hypothetical protein DV701_11170 [Ornithinimicrobium avium]|uniref:Lipoprotein n=1 Tax=Ornithinimicrobium avium TaxID=2283195 RepID=A0A345NNJ9_9MICO|nr:hypothetical protein DV701_11170 [Ornithinimicrobium avium]
MRAGALTATVLMLSACGGSGAVDVQEHQGAIALVAKDSEQGSDAEIGGVLGLGPGGCLGLLTEGSDAPVPLVWPAGSKLSEDGTSVTVPGLGEVRPGQTVTGGGGEDSNVEADRYSDVPEACLEQGRLVVAASIRSVTG